MYCVIKCIVRGNQARVKNADLHHPSCTVVMKKRKSASPVHNVLIFKHASLIGHHLQHRYFHISSELLRSCLKLLGMVYVKIKALISLLLTAAAKWHRLFELFVTLWKCFA